MTTNTIPYASLKEDEVLKIVFLDYEEEGLIRAKELPELIENTFDIHDWNDIQVFRNSKPLCLVEFTSLLQHYKDECENEWEAKEFVWDWRAQKLRPLYY